MQVSIGGSSRIFQKSLSLFNILEKDVVLNFNESCVEAYNILKQKLVTTLVIVALDWSIPFELMCDASDFMVGAILGQCKDNLFHTIYYASKTLNDI